MNPRQMPDTERVIPEGSASTFSGEVVSLKRPLVSTIRMGDIGHSLALQCRFNGHVRELYSVAQHSLLVARALEIWHRDKRLTRLGLLHDAAEAYTGDVIRAMKHVCPGVREIDGGLMRVIYEATGAGAPTEEEKALIKEADRTILLLEAEALMPPGRVYDPSPGRPVEGISISPWSPARAKRAFLRTWESLRYE